MKFSRIAVLVTMFAFVSCSGFAPQQATSNPIGTKRGTACSDYILGYHVSGKNHIYAAAKEGNINQIGAVDLSRSGFWPFSYTDCTYVSGN